MVRISAHTHDQCSEVDEINVMIWFQSQSTTTNNNKILEPDKPTYTLWLINHGISLAGRPISSTLFQRTASGNGLSNIYCSRSVPIKSLGPNFDLGVNRRLSQVPQMEKVTTTVSNLCHKLLKKNKDLSLYKRAGWEETVAVSEKILDAKDSFGPFTTPSPRTSNNKWGQR